MRKGSLIFYVSLGAIIVIAAIFVPVIFGSMESSVNMTNSTVAANYNATATIIQGSELVLYAGVVLLGVFAVVAGAMVLFRKRR
jgi:hypothetical protein